MQTFEPIRIGAKLSSHTSSPSQVFCPISNSQGYLILTPGLMTTPSPTLAPKTRRSARRTAEDGSHCDRSTGNPKKNQAALASTDRPGSYPELSNLPRSIGIMFFAIQNGKALNPL